MVDTARVIVLGMLSKRINMLLPTFEIRGLSTNARRTRLKIPVAVREGWGGQCWFQVAIDQLLQS